MSPLLGFHTVLGLVVSWVFRLNKIVTIVGVYVTNPWTIVPIYTFSTWLGAKLLGFDHSLADIDWAHISMKGLLGSFRPLLMPFILGSTVMAAISALLGYFLIFRAVRKRHE